jgi:lipoprotein-anchoring transpeptidase ErfK/SrfK
MASPPILRRAQTVATRHRVATFALTGTAALVLVATWMIPATASQPVAPSEAIVATSGSLRPMPTAAPTTVRAPVPASRTTKARHVPAFPRDHKHHGKRIVYDKALMTVWLIDKDDQVVARFPVVGRFDRPAKGTYHVFSKSPKAYNPNSKVTFNWMNRFTYGPDTKSAIGFHAIPRYYDGKPMHSTKQLGLPIARGGCVRLSEKAAKQVYDFLRVGTLVVVLPSP